MRGLFALSLVCGLLAFAGLTPSPTLALNIVVEDISTAYPCIQQGLGQAISDVGESGNVMFDCTSPTIIFESEILIGTGVTIDATHCSFATNGSHTVSVKAIDGDGGEATTTKIVHVYDPVPLCVNRWTGQLSMADDGDCS